MVDYLKNVDVIVLIVVVLGCFVLKIFSVVMVVGMKFGVLIVDLVVESGGNCELIWLGECVEYGGVSIFGLFNLLVGVLLYVLEMYVCNVFNFVELLIKDDVVVLDDVDELVVKSCVMCDGMVCFIG